MTVIEEKGRATIALHVATVQSVFFGAQGHLVLWSSVILFVNEQNFAILQAYDGGAGSALNHFC